MSTKNSNGSTAPWWQGAVVYQIYLRSFFDTNGDGIGDIPGVIAKLDYLASLGIDALWLSPIHPSPNCDWGYDVSGYEDVHPDFGTIADFDRLVSEAHGRGLKVILDEVLSHTSDQHPWFQQSLSGGNDCYIWADPNPDGTAPNNWLSAFGGPAWSYHAARRKYFHHKFLREQPRLDWHKQSVREKAAAVLSYWLKRGSDGFRLDVSNCYLHDENLRDNPPVPANERNAFHWSQASFLQQHVNDSNRPENIAALDFVRRTVEQFPDRFVFGEFWEQPEAAGSFLPPDKGLHSGYVFDLLYLTTLDPAAIRAFYAKLAKFPGHWPSLGFSNHDIMRAVSRFGGGRANSDLAKLILALLATLKGTILIYQGDELGLTDADVPREALKDPVGIRFYPQKGRDGCRTPMPWTGDLPDLGFTDGKPWLPPAQAHAALAVSLQERDANSTLSFARKVLSLRRWNSALRIGDMEFLGSEPGILAFTRRDKAETVLCVFNMGHEVASFEHGRRDLQDLLSLKTPRLGSGIITLPSSSVWIGSFS